MCLVEATCVGCVELDHECFNFVDDASRGVSQGCVDETVLRDKHLSEQSMDFSERLFEGDVPHELLCSRGNT